VQHGIHKVAAWLVLLAYLFSGIAPAEQLVLCIEPDGTVALEMAAPGGCTPCGPESLGDDSEGAGLECCPCTDIPLPSQSEDPQLRPKASGDSSPAISFLAPSHPAPFAIRESAPFAPLPAFESHARSAPRLALIRTVVLRV
jgi:hypothetical protein